MADLNNLSFEELLEAVTGDLTKNQAEAIFHLFQEGTPIQRRTGTHKIKEEHYIHEVECKVTCLLCGAVSINHLPSSEKRKVSTKTSHCPACFDRLTKLTPEVLANKLIAIYKNSPEQISYRSYESEEREEPCQISQEFTQTSILNIMETSTPVHMDATLSESALGSSNAESLPEAEEDSLPSSDSLKE